MSKTITMPHGVGDMIRWRCDDDGKVHVSKIRRVACEVDRCGPVFTYFVRTRWKGQTVTASVTDADIIGSRRSSAVDTAEERTEADKAVDYVREHIDPDDLLIIKATVSKNLKSRYPTCYGIDTCGVEELLYEYGEEAGIAGDDGDEEWWSRYMELDDIFMRL